uniref:Gypsy retrotransposon integrase-like protein 1 n=1 Tax=Oreochromis niloticus TaxID=8128 RepID=A0A669BX09_ORENI
MSVLRAPLHKVHLHSPVITGHVKFAVSSQLPIKGVSFILGNDLAGGNVFPLPEVVETPVASVTDAATPISSVFPVCAITRAQSRKFDDVMDVADTFMATLDERKSPSCESGRIESGNGVTKLMPGLGEKLNRDALITAQQNDLSLTPCFVSAAASAESKFPTSFFVQDGVLMRRWSPDQSGLRGATQVVVPKPHRGQVLSLAHDASMAGHLGVNKTYHRVLHNFFWPGLKADVMAYCRSCTTCQVAGKPNRPIPPAPLHPIPVIGEPFEKVILDCVGPLPKSKSRHQYILTIMCSATRFPEAIPLRTLKAKPVIKALIKFFSTFGLPKVIQTDQGTNFTSKVFAQVVDELQIKHVKSSPYHPESQGALERFHQTLKAMLRRFCAESGREWDEGLPLLFFAVREATQESLGFSPTDLVFGHVVRGPLRLLKEKWLSETSETQHNVLDYVSGLREKLHLACQLARENLTHTQAKMKARYDKKAVCRSFQPGEKVLVLLPVVGSSLQAQFAGPYVVEQKLSDNNYVIQTPDRRRKSRVCHINMLKSYHSRSPLSKPSPVCTASVVSPYEPSDDGLLEKSEALGSGRLKNSEILNDLDTYLAHLSEPDRADITDLIENNLSLFSDHPRQTAVLCHNIDVEGHKLIKQHAYRVNPVKRAIMQKEVDYLLEHCLAIPSASAWSLPCVLVPKSDNTPRFCNDYRKVNTVTKPDSFPLPRMEDCIDRVGSAAFVTKLDLLKGYWQVPLTPRASEISAFVTPDHFLQYTVMPFGLRNAPATFQRLMAKVLVGVNNCDAYLDDVVIYSSTWSDHLQTLSLVFSCFQKSSLTLNLAKCEFGRATVTYLGKQVGQGQVWPVTAKIQAIVEFPVPQMRRALRRFLGMCGYYRGFCKNFATVVVPLTDLISPVKHIVWTPVCQTAFESAKALLCSSPVLTAPNFTCPFKLEVDASASGAGAVLMQEDHHGVDRPICYFSKKFNKHQMNYSTIEKEALALLLALQHFEHFV